MIMQLLEVFIHILVYDVYLQLSIVWKFVVFNISANTDTSSGSDTKTILFNSFGVYKHVLTFFFLTAQEFNTELSPNKIKSEVTVEKLPDAHHHLTKQLSIVNTHVIGAQSMNFDIQLNF